MNITIADDIPIHKTSYYLGVLNGMGIRYKMDSSSPIYRTMREKKKERWQEAQDNKFKIPFDDEGARVLLSGGKEEDIKLVIRNIDFPAELREEKNRSYVTWRGKHHLSEDVANQRKKNSQPAKPQPKNGHDLIILGRGPSKEGCPVGEVETWATLSILEDEKWVDKPYSKLFCVERIPDYMEPWKPIDIAHKRGIPIVGDERYPWATEKWEQFQVRKRFQTVFALNAASHMIALALHRGYKSLWLWGIDQTNEYDGPMYKGWDKPENMYNVARHYVTYWLGIAHGTGARWEMSPNSKLWREGEDEVAFKFRKQGTFLEDGEFF